MTKFDKKVFFFHHIWNVPNYAELNATKLFCSFTVFSHFPI